MKIIYKSENGINLFLSNPFDNANYYLETLDIENFTKLNMEDRVSLFDELNQVKFRIMDFQNFKNLKSSKKELYRIIAKKLFTLIYSLQKFVDLENYNELFMFYENIDDKNISTEIPSEFAIEMEILDKEIKNNSSNQDVRRPPKKSRSAIFRTALVFAKIDGIYSIIQDNKFINKNGSINASEISKHFFNDTSCRTEVGYTLNKDLDSIDEYNDVHNKTKNVYYSLKNNLVFNSEFFEYLQREKIQTHPLFEEKIKFYNIKPMN